MLNNSEKLKPLCSERQKILLVVEDSEEDYEMLLRAVKKTAIECEVDYCETGEEALDYLRNQGEDQNREKFQMPSLILLDLNLPGTDGRDILKDIKIDPVLKFIPVVIFSTSSNRKDIEACYENGANAYVTKPMNISLLQEYIQTLLLHWLKVNRIHPNLV
jgi:CheY-like chemotaxis protein